MVMIGLVYACATPEPHELPPPLFQLLESSLCSSRSQILSPRNPSIALMKNGIQLMSYSIDVVLLAVDHL